MVIVPATLVGLVTLGLVLDHAPPRLARGGTLALLVLGLVVAAADLRAATPLVRMLGFGAVLLYGAKNLVLAAARGAGAARLPLAARLAFTLGWFGMNPRVFAVRRRGPLPGWRALLSRGGRNLLFGGFLVAGGCAVSGIAGALLLMVGLSLGVHFGLFHVLASCWRGAGYPCQALFVAPWRASTLHEFWTRRWNVGFAEMTALLVQRPVARRLGGRVAWFGSFLCSGVLHELVLSLPVRAGFGLPSAYFALQALAASRARQGRASTLACVLLPAPLVFHPWFVRGVVLPMVGGVSP